MCAGRHGREWAGGDGTSWWFHSWASSCMCPPVELAGLLVVSAVVATASTCGLRYLSSRALSPSTCAGEAITWTHTTSTQARAQQQAADLCRAVLCDIRLLATDLERVGVLDGQHGLSLGQLCRCHHLRPQGPLLTSLARRHL